MYYINDGVYGSFNCLLYDHAGVDIETLDDYHKSSLYPSSVWGPTCDGLDCVLETVELPDLEIGDWVFFSNMGAYTSAAGLNFIFFLLTYHLLDYYATIGIASLTLQLIENI